MKIGIQSSHVLDDLGYEEGLRTLSQMGFEAIDFNIDHELPGTQIRNGSRSGILYQSEKEVMGYLRPLKAAAEKYDIEIAQMHAPFPCYVPDQAAQAALMEALHMTIAAAAFLQCKYVVIHPAYLPYENDLALDDEWAVNRELFGALIPTLKKHDVYCCLENMFTSNKGHVIASVCADPHEACTYVDRLNQLAGEEIFFFCLDTGHTLLCARDIRETIQILGKRIKTMHVHDNDGLNDQHLCPYIGIFDWDRFCDGLRGIGFNSPLCLETFHMLNRFPKPLWPECLQLLAATARHLAKKIETGE